MSKEMTIEEALAYKEGLEINIAELVHEFYEDTGLPVTDLMFHANVTEFKAQHVSMSDVENKKVVVLCEQPIIKLVVSL